MFSRQLLDHFQNPRHAQPLEDPTVTVEVSNPVCGDILQLSAVVEQGRISAVAFKARGCTASMAAGSALTELIQGKDLNAAAAVSRSDVEQALGGLPNESKHVAVLAEDGARALATRAKERLRL